VAGVHATGFIAEATTAIRAELTATELARTIHSHSTLAEAWMEAAEVLLGEPIPTIAKKRGWGLGLGRTLHLFAP
jgi:dihydrolipoamide dehydrogenase